MIVYYPDDHTPRIPCVAIAAGSCIYIYKELKPLTSFQVPDIPIDEVEKNIWQKAENGVLSPTETYDQLKSLYQSGIQICDRSLQLLMLKGER